MVANEAMLKYEVGTPCWRVMLLSLTLALSACFRFHFRLIIPHAKLETTSDFPSPRSFIPKRTNARKWGEYSMDKSTNSMAYTTRRYNVAFTRAVQ